MVKYIIPILLIVIWVGGMIDILAVDSIEYIVVFAILGVILIASSILFTVLPAKTEEWFKTGERIK